MIEPPFAAVSDNPATQQTTAGVVHRGGQGDLPVSLA
jgi:hypothetical protein